MKRLIHGFTVVEMLMVITLLGIISGIGFVVWSGVVSNSNDRVRADDAKAWSSTFELYKSRFSVYPVLPDGVTNNALVCLGEFSNTSNPYNNKCARYASSTANQYASPSASLLTEVARVGNVPKNNGNSTNYPLVGPLAYLTQTTTSGDITVTAKIFNFFQGPNCPSGFSTMTLPSALSGALTGLPAGTSVIACALPDKTLTYTPGS